ncbi:MAG: DUF6538 domain-containing protein [Roseobacter sp.]|uniref:DUF6538 domain-containing protein n=1 Tax=Tateyamaria sp. TaxID=1929288 RepID=UPI00328D9B6B
MSLSSHYPATTLTENKEKWYVFCTIPEELRSEFGGRKQIKRSTGTSDKAEASRRQHSIASDIYAEFDSKKPNPVDDLSNLIPFPDHVVEKIVGQVEDTGQPVTLSSDVIEILRKVAEAQRVSVDRDTPPERPQKAREALTIIAGMTGGKRVSDAVTEYFDTKPYDKFKTEGDARRSVSQFQEFTKDTPLSEITMLLGHQWTRHLSDDGTARKTIAKKLGYVRQLLEFCVRTGAIPNNPLIGLKIDPRLGTAKKHYIPFTEDELVEIFKLKMPDHLKTLLSILVTTGMRLDEAALLDWDNIKKDHFDLTTSIVKTKGSARKVPIPKTIEHLFTKRSSGQLFPEFKRDKDGKAQSPASKALMKQIRKVTDDKQKVVHSLRGNLKDLLRDAGVTEEVNNFITGHGSGDVAGTYGSGPSLEVRREALDSVEHPWLT